LKCVPRQEGKDILEEIHKGVCGNHASSCTLVSKAFRRAFYWPTALGDAEELVRRCQGCQYFAKQQHVPAYKLVTIPPTWPFASWGARHDWATSNSARWIQPSIGGRRQVHQVDRGQAGYMPQS
jgi:hypothetical protein